jgi:hypothetical protein
MLGEKTYGSKLCMLSCGSQSETITNSLFKINKMTINRRPSTNTLVKETTFSEVISQVRDSVFQLVMITSGVQNSKLSATFKIIAIHLLNLK